MYSRLVNGRSNWLQGLVLTLALALILVACGDNNSNATSVPSTTSVAATPTTQPTTSGSATTAASGGSATAGDPANGLKLFQANNCGLCHANGGRTAGTGPVLAGTPRDDDYIRNQLKNGKAPMPAFPQLTEQQQTDLIAYIRSLK